MSRPIPNPATNLTRRAVTFGGMALPMLASPALAGSQDFRIEAIADRLDEPWGVAPLSDGAFLVSERAGRLWHYANGARQLVRGVPKVRARGQGGLLDITPARDFARTRTVFLTYARPAQGGAGTALASAALSRDGARLTGLRVLFAAPGSGAGQHFGSRVVEANDGTLFLTIGDRGDRPSAQDLGSYNGKILRIARNGGAAPGNPFAGQAGARAEIWSYGHRNPQGAGLDGDGRLWTSEHGPRGGDEVNRIVRGANYGWPVISYGRHYSGARIGEGTSKPGMRQPAHFWDPSIAPSGLLVYSGRLWPQWRGQIFVGSLKFNYIARLGGTPMRERAQINSGETRRVRDLVEAPDGTIWFLSVGRGALYRMRPAG